MISPQVFPCLKTTKRKRNGSRTKTKSPHDQQTTHHKWTRAANQIYTNTEPLATSLQSYHLPQTQSLRKCFWSPIGTTVAKVRKKPSLRKGTKTKRKKMPHIRAGYKDPLPKKKLIRPTIQVKNLTCLLTRVLFQESRRPSPMQSKQCRHFQRRLISKPLTLNRSLKPFLPPLSSKICVTPRLLILGTHHAWIRRTISLPQARKQRWKPSSKKTSKKNLNTLQHTHTHTHTPSCMKTQN